MDVSYFTVFTFTVDLLLLWNHVAKPSHDQRIYTQYEF